MKANITVFFMLALMVVSLVRVSAANSVNFPGKTSEIKSPNGFYTIRNVYQRDHGKNEQSNHLFFLRKGQKKRLALYSYSRNVDILWSPDSSAFVLNDWLGSNVAESTLYRVSDLAHPVSINSKLAVNNDKADKHSIATSGHIYTFASSWISPTSVEVKVAGHDGPDGSFTIFYLWDLKDSFKRIKRVSQEDTSTGVPRSDW